MTEATGVGPTTLTSWRNAILSVIGAVALFAGGLLLISATDTRSADEAIAWKVGEMYGVDATAAGSGHFSAVEHGQSVDVSFRPDIGRVATRLDLNREMAAQERIHPMSGVLKPTADGKGYRLYVRTGPNNRMVEYTSGIVRYGDAYDYSAKSDSGRSPVAKLKSKGVVVKTAGAMASDDGTTGGD